MAMGDGVAHDTPEPLNTVGLQSVGWRIHEAEVALRFGQRLPHQERAARGVRAQIIGDDDGHPSALTGANYSRAELFTEAGARGG